MTRKYCKEINFKEKYNDNMNQRCPFCHSPIQPDWFFCPQCGKVLQEKPIHISVGKQILMYLVCFFLAPFGLVWGIKYIRNKDRKVKLVGLVCIILTVVAIGVTIGTYSVVMNKYTNMLNNLGTGKYSFE